MKRTKNKNKENDLNSLFKITNKNNEKNKTGKIIILFHSKLIQGNSKLNIYIQGKDLSS
jgi:hypothetical protein